MKDAITYANEAGFFEFNVVGWRTEFERLIQAVRDDALAEPTVKESLTAQDHIPDATKMVKRPQNCGTGFCSCIECVVKPGHIAPVRKMVPDHIAPVRKMVPDHIAASGKVILTEEQAQQIEEALDELRYANNTDIAKTKYYKALAIIRAAKAQEQAEQPVSQEYQDHLVNQSFDWAAMSAKHQFMEGYRIGLAEMREKCAKIVTEHAPTCSPHWVSYVVAIRAINFEGDTGFRPVSEMVGCAYCNNPLFAGTKCNNCGRITLAEQAEHGEKDDT